MMLRVTNLRKEFGGQTLFEQVSFVVAPGEKVGIVGTNGCGKSTLLKTIAGLIESDEGRVEILGNFSVAYLPQHFEDARHLTLSQFLVADLYEKKVRIETIEKQLERDSSPTVLAAYERALEEFDRAGGYALELQLENVLAGLRMGSLNLSRPVESLSGGQRMRAALASIMLRDADIMLLDEPTNNLDLNALVWLERYLTACRSTCLIVSHDRELLDRVTSRTFELDALTKRLTDYSGNYTWYRTRKEQDEARQMRQYKEQQEQIKRLKHDINEVKQSALKVENATTNDYVRGRAKKVAAKAKTRETRLMRLLEEENVDKPRIPECLRFDLTGRKQYQSTLVRLSDATYAVQNHCVLRDVKLEIIGSQRIIVAGDNGAGKSTLLKLIAGVQEPSSGTVEGKENIAICYMPQHQESLPGNCSVIEFFQASTANRRSDSESRTFLHRFQFSGNDVFKKIANLSMGEKMKLLLASFMAGDPDLIVLDEPTNHLDISSLECLERGLQAFKGALVVVSHDRAFRRNISPHLVFRVAGGRVVVEPPELLD
ncbi:MAG TPA: ABC-F family ATP-binding cassette domain-containing protein [Candidatus Obscuribacterales bacterium]